MPTAEDPSGIDSDGEVVVDSKTAATASGTEPEVESSDRPTKKRRRLSGWLHIALSVGITILIVSLLLPQLPEEKQSIDTLRGLSIPLVVTALALEAVSLASYSAMTSLIFGTSIRYSTLLRIDLTTTGLSHAVPAGGATAAVFRMRLLHKAGLGHTDAVVGATVQATAANVVLGLVFLTGLGLLLAQGVDATSYGAIAATVIGVSLLAIAAGWMMLRRGSVLANWLTKRSRRSRILRGRSPDGVVRALSMRLVELVLHPSRTGRVLGCAALNWLLDASVLWVMLSATGHDLALGPLLVVYGLGNLLAIVPLTPGGLGVVEGAVIPALLGFGVPSASALIGVLGWRLWQFWLPIPVAGACYVSLRLEQLIRER